MSNGFKIGTDVKWKWGEGYGRGAVVRTFTSKVTRTLKGTDVTREADEESPAYLIEQDDGDQVLKSHTELEQDNQ